MKVILLRDFLAERFSKMRKKGVLGSVFSVEVEWAVFWVGEDGVFLKILVSLILVHCL